MGVVVESRHSSYLGDEGRKTGVQGLPAWVTEGEPRLENNPNPKTEMKTKLANHGWDYSSDSEPARLAHSLPQAPPLAPH